MPLTARQVGVPLASGGLPVKMISFWQRAAGRWRARTDAGKER